MKCPFLEEVVVRYCKAFPVRKMIPQHRTDAPCICLSQEYRQCSEYCAVSKMEEGEMAKQPQTVSVAGDPSFFPPGYYRVCSVYACSVCPYRGVCVAASAAERTVSAVRGFFLLKDLHYHEKHLWFKLRKDGTIRVGLDDFGRKLIGNVSGLSLPDEKRTLHQGEEFIEIRSNGRNAILLSPIAGEVVRVNRKLQKKPSLLAEDSYRSWLLTLKPLDLKEDLSRLMDADRAEGWLEKEVDRLHHRVETELGMTVADGGELMIPGRIDDEDWKSLVTEFLWVKE